MSGAGWGERIPTSVGNKGGQLPGPCGAEKRHGLSGQSDLGPNPPALHSVCALGKELDSHFLRGSWGHPHKVSGTGRGRKRGRDSEGVWDGHVHAALFKTDNRPTRTYRELCSMLRHSLDGRGVWGRMDTCVCMAESLRCPPESITTLFISYTPYKIESKKKRSVKYLSM